MSENEYLTKKVFSRNLKYYMAIRGMNNTELASIMRVSKQSVSFWVNGEKIPRMDKIEKLCQIFNINNSDLLEEKNKFVAPTVTDDVITFPVIGDIAAGYDKIAVEDWSGEKIEIPHSYLRGRSYNDYICLQVKGDSMYPLYHDGDKVLILKQNSINDNGDIAAIIYGNEYGTLKKIEISADKATIKLVPINPQYMPTTITGEDVEECHIIGIPKLVIREV